MNNNELLLRIKNALDIKLEEMVDIFNFGDKPFTEFEIRKLIGESEEDNLDSGEGDFQMKCTNGILEAFLNGLIIFKRGRKETKSDQPEKQVLAIETTKSVNNILLKKMKIALSLSSQDMLDIFESVGDPITKGELSDMFRKEGHKHYRKCNNEHVMNFLDGIEENKFNLA
ncbi:MAG: DUF1456 family protein [Clostridiales bacterium]|nr:DUF1456 family protein [Clostridiales bacterium]